MHPLTSIESIRWRRWTGLTALGVTLGGGACTLLLDHNATQCQSDADCASLGIHPYCRAGACVDSKLGPPGCFFGTPQQPVDFLNQCSTATYAQFDDCQRLHVCGDAGPPLASPPLPEAGPTGDAGVSDGAATDAGTRPSTTGPMPNCADLAAGNYDDGTPRIVYVTGSSNFPPLLQRVSSIILSGVGQLRPGPAVIFQQTNSCTGAARIFTSNRSLVDPPPGSTAQYAKLYAADGGTVPCQLGPNGTPVDVGESDVYAETCSTNYRTGNGYFTDSLGPIQAMGFVVPRNQMQDAISEEAAREVFGLGASNGVAVEPWTNPEQYFVRNKNAGTQQMIGLAIHVAPDQFWGVDKGTAVNVHDAIYAINANPNDAQRAIGIISVDGYDGDRDNLKLLAYRAAGQRVAYLPDSSPSKTSRDKRNVRDGHYPIWGPLHLFTSNQSSQAANAFLDFLAGTSVNQAVLDAFIGASLVPDCAMSVARATNAELAELKPYQPEKSCACYFESETQSDLPPECTPCQADNDCSAARPFCNFGWCELR